MKFNIFIFCISLILSCNVLAYSACSVSKSEKVVRTKLLIKDIADIKCNSKDENLIDDAIGTIKVFWEAKSNHERYFSENYVLFLKKYNLDFRTKHSYLFPSERIWVEQEYIKGILHNEDNAQITVLSTWSQEGYRGTTTFIFDLIFENGSWKISNMIY